MQRAKTDDLLLFSPREKLILGCQTSLNQRQTFCVRTADVWLVFTVLLHYHTIFDKSYGVDDPPSFSQGTGRSQHCRQTGTVFRAVGRRLLLNAFLQQCFTVYDTSLSITVPS